MQKSAFKTTSAALLSIIACSTLAKTPDHTSSMLKHMGIYIAGGLGFAHTNWSKAFDAGGFKDPFTVLSYSNKKGPLNQFVGRFAAGFSLNQYLGVEGGVTAFHSDTWKATPTIVGNTTSSQDVKIQQREFDIFGVLSYPLSKNITVFTKLGAAHTRMTQTVTSAFINQPGPTEEDTESYWAFKYGLGIGYALSNLPHLLFNVQWLCNTGKSGVTFDKSQFQPYKIKIPVTNTVLFGAKYLFAF